MKNLPVINCCDVLYSLVLFQMTSGTQGLKAFVTETEIEEKKKKRQEEWEKVRKADDPEGVVYLTRYSC